MSNHIIEQILASADIVKIIGKHVELKRSGNEFKGCCPFHGEKTPSFFVNPQKNLYNCFGCGVKGNALTFLKEYENLTAGEALKELSHQTGIELPKDPINPKALYKRKNTPKPKKAVTANINPTPSPADVVPTDSHINIDSNSNSNINIKSNNEIHSEDVSFANPLDVPFDTAHIPFDHAHALATSDVDSVNFAELGHTEISFDDIYDESYQSLAIVEQDDGSSSLYDLLTQVSRFYQQQLAQNSFAQQYFIQRGLTQDTLEEFALGYAPTGWQHLEQAFPRDIEGLKILGLVRESQKGRDYDLLRNRVIFPIRDNQGRIVGFAGRSLNDEDMPKYINSSDSPVFHKQHILYGLYEGRKARAKDWLVVEGYMDVISLHQAGVYGAVASMGTAIATSQIERLLQLNPVLTLSFDGDSAGQKAAWRAMEVGLPALTDGKELRFLTLPNNHDPDSFVKAHGKTAMQTQISNAVPMSQYLFSVLSRRYDITIAEGRGKLLAEISELTRKLPKGSYGWLLREDMRHRMGLGKREQSRAAQDALINFKGSLNKNLFLQLCLIYQPEILGKKLTLKNTDTTTINNEALVHIYYLSKAAKVYLPKQTKKGKKTHLLNQNNAPLSALQFVPAKALPKGWRVPNSNNFSNLESFYQQITQYYQAEFLTWQDIADEETLQLIDWIQQIQPQLYKLAATIDNYFARINAKAHFILAGLPFSMQQKLFNEWIVFFDSLSHRNVIDISVLIHEMVTNLLIQTLNQPIAIKTNEDFERFSFSKAQSQTINGWFQKWQQQTDD